MNLQALDNKLMETEAKKTTGLSMRSSVSNI